MVLTSLTELLHYIRQSTTTTPIHGYVIHSTPFPTTDATSTFWTTHASIINQLRLINRLCLMVAFIHPDHDKRSVSQFHSSLKRSGWLASSTPVFFPDIGDTISGFSTVTIAVHSSTTPDATAIQLRQPPSIAPTPLANYIWEPFNTKQYAVATSPLNDATFTNMTTTVSPPSTTQVSNSPRVKFYIHPDHMDKDSCTCDGAAVLDVRGSCPGSLSPPNSNIFQHFFGIEFLHEGIRYLRPISQFEFAACYRLRDSFTYSLAHPTNRCHLDAGIPGLTSAWVLDSILTRLLHIRDENTECYDTTPSTPSHPHLCEWNYTDPPPFACAVALGNTSG